MRRLGWHGGFVVAVVAGLAGSGCYDRALVRPTELPKLSAGAHELKRTDGGRFQVRRTVTAKVSTPNGSAVFVQPQAKIIEDDDMLLIAGSNGAAASIPLDDISAVRVSQLNVIDTTASLIVLGATIAVSVLFFSWVRGAGGGSGAVE
jgi:hypothetical protein